MLRGHTSTVWQNETSGRAVGIASHQTKAETSRMLLSQIIFSKKKMEMCDICTHEVFFSRFSPCSSRELNMGKRHAPWPVMVHVTGLCLCPFSAVSEKLHLVVAYATCTASKTSPKTSKKKQSLTGQRVTSVCTRHCSRRRTCHAKCCARRRELRAGAGEHCHRNTLAVARGHWFG